MDSEGAGGAAKAIGGAVAAVVLASIFLVAILTGSGATTDCQTAAATSGYGMGVQSANGATVAGLNPKQTALAANGVAIGKQRGEPDSVILAQSMAMATESTYRNLSNKTNVPGSEKFPNDGDGSDHDSVGPHQVRASVHAGGDLKKLMDPVWQINWFYDTADKVPGKATMDAAALAQAVEISGPDAYATTRTLAEKVIAAVTPKLGELATTTGGSSSSDGGAACSGSAEGDPNSPLAGPFGQRIIAAASRWIGMQYSWGGGNWYGPTVGIHDGGTGDSFGDYARVGFDCSGLTMYALYQASGGAVRTAHFTGSQQGDSHAHPIPTDQKQPGDLIYFGSSAAGSHHVGIYWGKKDGKDMLLNAPQSGQKIAIMPLSGWAGEGMYVRRFSYPGDDQTPRTAPGPAGGTNAGRD
ncbi:C40 family peptidase [Williamsia sp. MIQD14]|uniref:C40 family peptidase n=1 Tax=Williamsia sp. MIQD14 TaxID=3425703 RepID=UPI003D9FD65A